MLEQVRDGSTEQLSVHFDRDAVLDWLDRESVTASLCRKPRDLRQLGPDVRHQDPAVRRGLRALLMTRPVLGRANGGGRASLVDTVDSPNTCSENPRFGIRLRSTMWNGN